MNFGLTYSKTMHFYELHGPKITKDKIQRYKKKASEHKCVILLFKKNYDS